MIGPEINWNVLQIYMAKEMIWENVIVFFHNETDFLEDWNNLAWHLIKMKESPQKVMAGLSKKVFSSPSTKHTPCAEYPVQKCIDMSLKKELFALHNCQVPFMFTGKSQIFRNIKITLVILNILLKPNLGEYPEKRQVKYCNNSLSLDTLKQWKEPRPKKCPNVEQCHKTKYDMEIVTYDNNQTVLYVRYQNPVVEYRISYVNYDLQSWISEIGGTIGLTLGISGLSLVEVMSIAIKNLFVTH